MNNIANLYTKQGDLDKALEYFERCLEIFEADDHKYAQAVVLGNKGNILKMRDEFDEALNHFERSYKLFQEVGNPMQVHWGLNPLIALLSVKDREQAKVYRDKLEIIEEKYRDKINNITLDLKNARAIYLKNSPRLRDKMRAQELYEEIFQENKELGLSNIEIIPHLIELLLLEYGTSKEEHLLVELGEHLNSFQTEAEKNHMYPAIIKFYLIKSQLLIVEGKFKESEALLDQAVGFAMEKNLTTLLKELNEVRSDLAEVQRMQVLLQSNSDLATRLNKSKILEYIKKAQESVVTGSN